ncbi:MAG: hypothetical protein BWY71_01195 [Planctomycetes bacterium ADurb.Bin412]|nr:MAG: hypothetical protein BWY71_01195 [Planctomycetes bacterium ADurb.Bin412]
MEAEVVYRLTAAHGAQVGIPQQRLFAFEGVGQARDKNLPGHLIVVVIDFFLAGTGGNTGIEWVVCLKGQIGRYHKIDGHGKLLAAGEDRYHDRRSEGFKYLVTFQEQFHGNVAGSTVAQVVGHNIGGSRLLRIQALRQLKLIDRQFTNRSGFTGNLQIIHNGLIVERGDFHIIRPGQNPRQGQGIPAAAEGAGIVGGGYLMVRIIEIKAHMTAGMRVEHGERVGSGAGFHER